MKAILSLVLSLLVTSSLLAQKFVPATVTINSVYATENADGTGGFTLASWDDLNEEWVLPTAKKQYFVWAHFSATPETSQAVFNDPTPFVSETTPNPDVAGTQDSWDGSNGLYTFAGATPNPNFRLFAVEIKQTDRLLNVLTRTCYEPFFLSYKD